MTPQQRGHLGGVALASLTESRRLDQIIRRRIERSKYRRLLRCWRTDRRPLVERALRERGSWRP